MLKDNAAKLLVKEMNRKDFLKHIGIGVVALTGLSAVLHSLANETVSISSKKIQNRGYGSSVYEGDGSLVR